MKDDKTTNLSAKYKKYQPKDKNTTHIFTIYKHFRYFRNLFKINILI